ncbi:hypothetical protein KAFR_0I00830 [Kazachstania africana CBS 2517]|uniref:Uncharacterized protein n=1 Tax=Kazachstania africana (strain ATCC 22294 / BCRC 22015 / CBS 2517 / CECT 1963 / NBRC 1671 / NRRL Y-8276) TaxID=1071382 RepID=H2AZR4_KAZAF|nr:hypothetical protein KAFR_0I00830 [Kazachstania africana CBS 2517]CCF59864.1 hypothetical protein KAFR_0I00830 [Kazachstania africana CBS 2517]
MNHNKERQSNQQKEKEQRTKDRILRLKNASRTKLRDKIKALEVSVKTDPKRKQLLMQLQRDLEFMEQYDLGYEKQERNDNSLGKKSIFYDKDWNPDGIAPKGYRNIPHNPTTFVRKTRLTPQLSGLSNIKLPKV